jgi:hypothetical protein
MGIAVTIRTPIVSTTFRSTVHLGGADPSTRESASETPKPRRSLSFDE